MSAFKPGDKVLIPATVKEAWPGDELIFVAVGGTLPTGGVPMYVNADAVQPVPEPPYVDPELVPGMVVAPLDKTSAMRWWVEEPAEPGCFAFRTWLGTPQSPEALPKIRVVFDPREVAS